MVGCVRQLRRSISLQVTIITNFLSRGNRKGGPRALTDASAAGRLRMVPAGNDAQLSEVIAGIVQSAPELLVINGGDGTVQVVMSELLKQLGRRPPPLIALLPGGTTNMTADDINGERLSLNNAVKRLLQLTEAGDLRRAPQQARPMLEIVDGEDTRYGFFFGVGAVVDGIEYCHEQIYQLGITGALAPGLTLLRAALGIAVREGRFTRPCTLRLKLPETTEKRVPINMFFASTLERLILGSRPFWGEQGGAVHCTLVGARPHRFMRNLRWLLRGQPGDRLTPAHGYCSQSVAELTLMSDGHYIVDGEFFPMPAAGLHVSASQPLTFLALGEEALST